MKVALNGEPRELPEGFTVLALIELLGLEAERVAVEVNANVVRKAAHAQTVLAQGDRIEVVTFVGGG